MVLVRLNLLLSSPDLGVHLPVNGRDRCGVRRAAWVGIMWRFDQVVALHLVLGPRLLQCRQRCFGALGGLEALGLQVKECF